MRFVLTALAAFLVATQLLIAPASAEEPANPAITGVIQNQIEAFQKDDFAEAFSYASPNIKRLFGSSERFGQMVRNGYPMVWRPSQVEYLELRDISGRLFQKVLIRDANGVYHTLDYQMIQTENGWQINGVQILPTPQVGA